jgi:hypothetical protein
MASLYVGWASLPEKRDMDDDVAVFTWCQVQAGTEYHLLESPEFPVDYIESCWIMNVHDFCECTSSGLSSQGR